MRRTTLRRIGVPRSLTRGWGLAGALTLVALLALAVAGPLLAPHPLDEPVADVGQLPGPGLWLGADQLGRDVFSRTLHGGLTTLGVSVGGTLALYLVGVPLGVVAGYRGGWVDAVTVRAADVLLALPGLLLALLLVAGLGGSGGVLLLCVVLTQLPALTRLVRTATLEAGSRAFVEAARARGESAVRVVGFDVLPTIRPVILADAGLRLRSSVIVVAGLNFLGLGLHPPTADWGLMISENRDIIGLNPWAALAPGALLALFTVAANAVGDESAATRTATRTAARTAAGTAAGTDPTDAAPTDADPREARP
ncbi:ABC transporter permease [Streptomyces radicis]|uniref:ABC transporter permease n=1 Tax=Streptomyces radicis TaxID=1750517 RepID=UPI0015FFE6D6|nr:ABC transporter permease [Streptomyces radicis]